MVSLRSARKKHPKWVYKCRRMYRIKVAPASHKKFKTRPESANLLHELHPILLYSSRLRLVVRARAFSMFSIESLLGTTREERKERTASPKEESRSPRIGEKRESVSGAESATEIESDKDSLSGEGMRADVCVCSLFLLRANNVRSKFLVGRIGISLSILNH